MNDLVRRPVIDRCKEGTGCKKIIKEIVDGEEKDCCKIYLYPDVKWKFGDCPTATHVEKKIEEAQKKRVGQQKQKKR